MIDEADGSGLQARRVLVVDDDPFLREALLVALKLEGYAGVGAGDGIEGLTAIDREPPDVIVLDLQMPRLDGRGFARELRRRGRRIPIVVISAATDGAVQTREINADAYLAKPFELADLFATIRRLLA